MCPWAVPGGQVGARHALSLLTSYAQLHGAVRLSLLPPPLHTWPHPGHDIAVILAPPLPPRVEYRWVGGGVTRMAPPALVTMAQLASIQVHVWYTTLCTCLRLYMPCPPHRAAQASVAKFVIGQGKDFNLSVRCMHCTE